MTKTLKTLLVLVWRMNVIFILKLRPVTVKVPAAFFAFIQITFLGTSCSLHPWSSLDLLLYSVPSLLTPHLKCHPVSTGN